MNIAVNGTFFFLSLATVVGFLVELALKSTLLLVLCYLFSKMLKRYSAATKSLIWTIAFIGVLFLPFLHINLPAFDFSQKDATETTNDTFYLVRVLPEEELSGFDFEDDVVISAGGSTESIEQDTQEPGLFAFTQNISFPHWSYFLVAVWCMGVLYLVIRWFMSYISVRGLIKNGRKNVSALAHTVEEIRAELGIKVPVKVKVSERVHIPFIWGIFTPKLVLPAEAESWDKDSLRSVIIHELAHVKRFDLVRLKLFRIACALNWFNPMIWLASKRAKLEIEGACDNEVINAGYKQDAYARRLLGFAVRMREVRKVNAVGLAMVRKSAFEERITNIVDQGLDRRPSSKFATGLISLVILLAIIPLAALNTVSSTSETINSSLSHYFSQDGNELMRVEDALRCFPAGNYEAIKHIDYEAFRNADFYRLYLELFTDKGILDDEMEVLPETLKRNLLSCTKATLTRYKFSEVILREDGTADLSILTNKDGSERKDTGAKSIFFTNAGDKKIAFVNFGNDIAVYRYEKLAPTLKRALANKEISKTPLAIAGRTVFRIEQGEEGNPYILPLESGELLLADKIELIEKMHDAWSGNNPGIISEEGMDDFISLGSELGQQWQYYNFVNTAHPSVMKMMSENGVSDEEIKRIANIKIRSALFIVETMKVGLQIEEKDFRIYIDQEAARNSSRWSQNQPEYRVGDGALDAVKAFYEAKVKGRDIKLNDRHYTASTIWDDELIKLNRAAIKAKKLAREVREKQQTAEKDK